MALGPGALRLGLAGCVVLSHLSDWEIGRPAVFLFFLLSGYWVIKIYNESYRSCGGVWHFYLSRGLRIWLPYGAVLLLISLSQLGQSETEIALKSWGLLGIASHGQDPLGVSWSLDIELQFYLLVPCLVWVGARLPWTLNALACTAGAVLGWGLILIYGVWTVWAFLPAFGLGAAFALTGWQVSKRQAVISGVSFAAAGGLLLVLPGLQSFLSKSPPDPLPADLLGLAWTGLAVPGVMWINARATGRFDRHLGDISYPLYLLHWPVIAGVMALTPAFGSAEKLGALGLITVAVLAFYVALDRPLERFRRHVLNRWVPLAPRMRVDRGGIA